MSEPSAQYLAQDPISFMEHYLRRRDLWSDEWSRSILDGFNRQLNEAPLLSKIQRTRKASSITCIHTVRQQLPRGNFRFLNFVFPAFYQWKLRVVRVIL